MDKEELKDRFDKADDRLILMAKKYPVLLTLLVTVCFVAGLVIGKWAL